MIHRIHAIIHSRQTCSSYLFRYIAICEAFVTRGQDHSKVHLRLPDQARFSMSSRGLVCLSVRESFPHGPVRSSKRRNEGRCLRGTILNCNVVLCAAVISRGGVNETVISAKNEVEKCQIALDLPQMRSLVILLQSHSRVIHLCSKIDRIFDSASSVSCFRGSSRGAKIKRQ